MEGSRTISATSIHARGDLEVEPAFHELQCSGISAGLKFVEGSGAASKLTVFLSSDQHLDAFINGLENLVQGLKSIRSERSTNNSKRRPFITCPAGHTERACDNHWSLVVYCNGCERHYEPIECTFNYEGC